MIKNQQKFGLTIKTMKSFNFAMFNFANLCADGSMSWA